MNVQQLADLIDAKVLTVDVPLDREIECGYSCDLLSWVMAKGRNGMAWVSVQTHMNVIAVACLSDMACIILPESIQMDKEPLLKAQEEGIPVMTSALSAYEICGKMYESGIGVPS